MMLNLFSLNRSQSKSNVNGALENQRNPENIFVLRLFNGGNVGGVIWTAIKP